MIQKIYNVTSLEQLSSVALELLTLSDNRIFALYGDLGVGKTTLVKYLCYHLKVVDDISSPIVNEYLKFNKEKVFHFDLYRVKNIEELEDLGIDTYLSSGSYCFIEWPKLIKPLILNNVCAIEIKEKNNKRELYLIE